MSPDNPQDPQKGKPFEQEQAAQDAKDAATEAAQVKAEETAEAEAAPKAKGKRAAKAQDEAAQAEGTAAETTGVDKAGAEAAAVTEPADEPVAEEPTVEEPAAEAAPAEEKPKRTRAKKEPAEEAAATPAEKPAPAPRRDRKPGELVIVRAQAKYVRSSPRKARLVCDHIRGKSVSEARAILAFSPRSVAEAWQKLLESAVANAENNHDLVGEELKIHAVFADAGPTIKRFRPRAMGRATRIRKRTSHLTIQLTPIDQPATGGKRSRK